MNVPCDIIFLDETGFSNFLTKSKGWAPRGSGYIKFEEIHKSKSQTLVLAVSYYYGVIAYQILENGLNQASFLYFLANLKTIYESQFLKNDHKYSIYMENLKAHKTKNVID